VGIEIVNSKYFKKI